MTTLPCPECGAPLQLKDSKYGKFYGCSMWRTTGCKGSHSAHKDTGAPMGLPARAAVKAARVRAHRAFDSLWTGGAMTRKAAYKWLQKAMKLSKRECHIAAFDEAQCEQVILEVSRLRSPRSA
jgi:ssDNA-binding Zn-finger/Zn-ribbon topoisomerase 1